MINELFFLNYKLEEGMKVFVAEEYRDPWLTLGWVN